MKSKRPYLIRATIDWLADSGYTQVVAVRLGPDVKVSKLDGVAGSLGAFLLTPAQAKSVVVTDTEISGVAQVAAKDEAFVLPLSALVSICCVETGDREVFEEMPAVAAHSASVPPSHALAPVPSRSVAPDPEGSKPRLVLVKS